MTHKSCLYKVTTTLLALGLLLGVCGGAFAAAVDVDEKYQVIFDMVEEGFVRRPMAPSEVYDKYGDMNGDYYLIALEWELNAPDGICTIAPLTILYLIDQLYQDGEISLTLRTKLRKSVETYGLDCKLPDDPSFPDGGTELPVPTREPSTGSEVVPFEGEDAGHFQESDRDEPKVDVTPTSDSKYADVTPDVWYYEAVTAMSEGGLFKGYDDGLFHPDDNITYGQWAMLISRIAIDNYTYQTKPGDHWAAEAYSKASRDGICHHPNTKLGENLDSLYNRGQAIGCSYSLAYGDKRGLENCLANQYAGNTWTLDDIPDGELVRQKYSWISGEGDWWLNSTGRWNDEWVLGAYNLGITHGVDANGTCNPTAPITRAEVAQLLYNMGIYYEKQCDLRVGGIGS